MTIHCEGVQEGVQPGVLHNLWCGDYFWVVVSVCVCASVSSGKRGRGEGGERHSHFVSLFRNASVVSQIMTWLFLLPSSLSC